MPNANRSLSWVVGLSLFPLAVVLLSGCQCCKTPAAADKSATAAKPAAVVAAPVVPAAPAMPRATLRINAGLSSSVTDSEGNVWLADQGFADGETIERPDLQIANTKNPVIYRSERYSMTAYSWAVPNGKYVVKLHFAETYDGITAPGERVFSFSVEGHEFKNFDVWAKAGGTLRAYVETVNVDVTDGKLDITFTPQVQNPQINGIEIIPAA